MIECKVEDKDRKLVKAYDEAIKKSYIDNNKQVESYLMDNGIYFNEGYKTLLVKSMTEVQKEALKNEYNKVYSGDRIKMCSAASSARLCYLKLNKDECIFEEIVCYKGCNPHFDAYKQNNNEYYECKCHEIVNNHPYILKEKPYKSLLKEVFGIDINTSGKDIVLSYEMFGIKDNKDLLPIGKYFDFKQLICHIIGLSKFDNKPSLKYLFFIPNEKNIQGNIKSWKDRFESHVKYLFGQIKDNATIKGKAFSDCISLSCEFIDVSTIDDVVIKK